MNKFNFSICIGLQNHILVKAWIKHTVPVVCFLSEAGWRVAFLICEKVLVGRREGYLVLLRIKQKILFLISHELETERIFHSDNPSTWNFLQEITSLHAAAAQWNQHSWYFHACWSPTLLSPAAARVPQPCACTARAHPHSPAATPSHSSTTCHTSLISKLLGSSLWRQNLPSLSALQQKAGKPWSMWLSSGLDCWESWSTLVHQYPWLNVYLT